MYCKRKVDSFYGSMLLKIPIILKNVLNKSCCELNFLQEPQWTHISISPGSGAKGSKGWSMLIKHFVEASIQ